MVLLCRDGNGPPFRSLLAQETVDALAAVESPRIVILFCDIVKFTSLSEKIGAKRLLHVVNEFLAVC